MNVFKKLSPLIIAMFVGCTQSKEHNETKPVTFGGYIKSLDIIPLPFIHSCSGPDFPQLSIHFDSSGFKKFKDPNCVKPLGIIFNDNTNVITVDISLADNCSAPVLVSFDKKGKKLDVLSLYSHSFEDTASSSDPYFKIDKNKKILVIDTSKQWKLDTAGQRIPGSLSIIIDSTIYDIAKSGKFIKKSGTSL